MHIYHKNVRVVSILSANKHISPYVAHWAVNNMKPDGTLQQRICCVWKSVLTLVVRKNVSKLTSSLKSISKVFLGFLLRVSLSGKWSTAEDEVRENRRKIVTLHAFSRGRTTIRESSRLLEEMWKPNFTQHPSTHKHKPNVCTLCCQDKMYISGITYNGYWPKLETPWQSLHKDSTKRWNAATLNLTSTNKEQKLLTVTIF